MAKQMLFISKIEYIYDATGVKQMKKVTNGAAITTTDYAGNYIYETDVQRGSRTPFRQIYKREQNGNLQFFNTPEGYAEPINAGNYTLGFRHTYQYKDHLGNIRLSYKDLNENTGVISLSIVEENNYYPFGLKHKGYNNVVNGTENNYQTFQEQEDEKELGKNTYAFQWRDYDPAIARFNKIDRFAEKYQSINPYHFSANNPIFFREIKGDSINFADLYRMNKDKSYVNPNQVKAFEFFAKTKEGRKFLAHFASKGQKIAGHEFKSNGKFHNNRVDLNYIVGAQGLNAGNTGVGKGNNRLPDDNKRFQINVSLGTGEDAYDDIDTVVHESFIHAFRDANDIWDNGEADHSIIDRDLMNWLPKQRHHYQEDEDLKDGVRTLFGTDGYEIMKNANVKYKKFKNDEEIWNSMYNYIK